MDKIYLKTDTYSTSVHNCHQCLNICRSMEDVCLFLAHKMVGTVSERIHGTNVPLCHSTDFLDLVPFDFHLFLELKKKLGGM